MIAAVIFVLAFLVLGLSVLIFAFSGRAGARYRREAPSRAGRRFVAVMVTIVIVALGVAVPLAVGVVNKNHHATDAPGGVDLNAAQTNGRAGARYRREAPSRAGRRFVAVVVTIVIVALGVAVPLAVGVVNKNHHATDAPGGVDLNAAQTNGRAVFGKYCATCHTLKASNAVGKVGPNLDVLHPPKGLILDAIANGRARGQGQMPAGLVDGQDAQDVAAYVAAVAGRG